MPVSDNQLIEEFRAGDTQAFGVLVQRYQDTILSLAYDLVHNYDDGKDLAQETFLKAYRKIAQFRGASLFSTWLYRIAVNLAIDFHRRRKRPYAPLHAADLSDLPAPEAVPADSDTEERIATALATLSVNQRVAVTLKYFYDKNAVEIAEILGCSHATARIHIFRALKNLKQQLVNTTDKEFRKHENV